MLADFVAEKLGIKVLSCEYQILLELFEHLSATSGELSSRCRVAPATFHKSLGNLASRQLVWWEKDREDGRRRTWRLCDDVRDFLDEELRFQLNSSPPSADENPEDGVFESARRQQERLRTKVFSSEFQILLSIYDNGRPTTGELQRCCDTSPGAFYMAMKRLGDLKLIAETKDSADRRRKHYHLTGRAREALDEFYVGLREWSKRLPQ